MTATPVAESLEGVAVLRPACGCLGTVIDHRKATVTVRVTVSCGGGKPHHVEHLLPGVLAHWGPEEVRPDEQPPA